MSLFGVVSHHSNSGLGRAAEVNKATQTLVQHILTHTAFYKTSSPLGLFHSAVRFLENSVDSFRKLECVERCGAVYT